MKKQEKDNPWLDIEAITWSKDGRLLIRGKGSTEFVDGRKFLYSQAVLGKDLGPINYIGCTGSPQPTPPNFICSTVEVKAIRALRDGFEVRTDLGVKRLDELFHIRDVEAER